MIDILSLPNWSVVNVERDDTCVIHAQFTIRPEHCVKCGSTSIVKHGTTTSSFIDIPYCAQEELIALIEQSHICQICSVKPIGEVSGLGLGYCSSCFDKLLNEEVNSTQS